MIWKRTLPCCLGSSFVLCLFVLISSRLVYLESLGDFGLRRAFYGLVWWGFALAWLVSILLVVWAVLRDLRGS